MNSTSKGCFPPELFETINHYVYRLIDPRDGLTFYVGQGENNRIFDHIESAKNSPDRTNKLDTIREILRAGLEPIHVIHRHGMNEYEADEVEAALIDAFSGLTNDQGGIGSAERGPAHVEELIQKYGAKEMVFDLSTDKLLLIKINKTAAEKDVYEAVRYAWKINVKRAEKVEYVLAIDRGICKGGFQAARMAAGDLRKLSYTDGIGS